jgi:ankyrin repeat protein
MDVHERVLNMQRHQQIDDILIFEPRLYIASRNGDLEAVKYIITSDDENIKQSPNITAKYRNLFNFGCNGCLHIAAQNGHLDVVKYLVEAGADIHKTNMCCWTPLHIALRHREWEISQYLIEAGANAADELNTSISDGNFQIIQFLVEKGLRVKRWDIMVSDTLMSAQDTRIVKYIIKKFPLETCSNLFTNGKSPLYAVADFQVEIINIMFDQISNLDESDDSGWFPIHYLALQGLSYLMKELLKRGVRKNVLTPDGFDALDIAFLNGDDEMMELLSL